MEDESIQSKVEFPEQFDEVVDIVVSDSRAKAMDKIRKEEKMQAESKTYEDVMEGMGFTQDKEEEKPFWA